METMNTPPGWNNGLGSILEWLTDEQKDKLLEILRWLTNEQKDELQEMLIKDKKLREEKRLSESWKLINSELEYLGEIIDEIETMKKSVDEIRNQDRMYQSLLELILDDVNNTLDKLKPYRDEQNNKNTTSSDIKADIQKILIKGLRPKGWINYLMTFLSYSRSPIINIKDRMKWHWIDVSLLESICSGITKMLNEVNMEVVVPAVLEDKFDSNLHDYKNSETWIDYYFTDLSLRDYKGLVYDIFSIGYKIKDEEGNVIESRNPTVYYL